MNNFTVEKAVPESKKLLMGLIAPSSGGKTASALRIATGLASKMNNKIVVIDTENKRSADYANKFNFHIIPFAPPYTGENYLAAMKAAKDWGADVIIVDSFSHEHEGEGGVLEQHEKFLDKKCGDSYSMREKFSMVAWNDAKKGRKKIILELQKNDVHTILCFRAKKKMKLVKNEKGKTEPVDIGFQIIGAEEFGYEIKIAAYLPPNSQGEPDWQHENARINDMDGKLKNYLLNVKQLNEKTGVDLFDMLAQPIPQSIPANNDERDQKAESGKKELLDIVSIISNIEHVASFLTQNATKIKWLETNYPAKHQEIMSELQAKENELKTDEL